MYTAMATPPSAQSLETENPVLVRATGVSHVHMHAVPHAAAASRARVVRRQTRLRLYLHLAPPPTALALTRPPAPGPSLQAAALAIDDAAYSTALCVLPACFVLGLLATVGVRPAPRQAARGRVRHARSRACPCVTTSAALTQLLRSFFSTPSFAAKAELHFKAAGAEDWAPLLLFLGGLALVVFAVRPTPWPAHTPHPRSLLTCLIPPSAHPRRPWSTPACNTSPPRRLPKRRNASSGTARRCSVAGCTPHRRPATALSRLLPACMTLQHILPKACLCTAPWASSRAKSTARR